MHVKRYCMNLVYFDQQCHTIIYSENMTPVLQYLSYFSVLLVIQRLHGFISTMLFASIIHFFFKIRKFLTFYEAEKDMTLSMTSYLSKNIYKNVPNFVLVL